MAVCPYCVVTKQQFLTGVPQYVGCTAKSNPGNTNGNNVSTVGVAYAKCYEGQTVKGMTIQNCPFYKKG